MYAKEGLSQLLGKKVSSVEGEKGCEEFFLYFEDGSVLRLYHHQECYEDVWLEDVCGDVNDLVGYPLLICEEVSSVGYHLTDTAYRSSCTWTSYRFATRRGWVELRWCGTSNGYYSEEVDVEVKLVGD